MCADEVRIRFCPSISGTNNWTHRHFYHLSYLIWPYMSVYLSVLIYFETVLYRSGWLHTCCEDEDDLKFWSSCLWPTPCYGYRHVPLYPVFYNAWWSWTQDLVHVRKVFFHKGRMALMVSLNFLTLLPKCRHSVEGPPLPVYVVLRMEPGVEGGKGW